jgi:hypothetical protein
MVYNEKDSQCVYFKFECVVTNLNVLLRSSNDGTYHGRGAAISWQSRATPSKHRSPARFQVISPFPISIPFAQLYVLLPRTLGS